MVKLCVALLSFISQTVFQSDYTILIPTSNEWVPIAPHPHQHLVLSRFQALAVLIGDIVFICGPWWCTMLRNFHMLTCISSLVRCLVRCLFRSLLLLLSRFSRVRLCATPETAAHQAPPSLGFSRQEHWSGLPFPSPMHESEKRKWSHSVVSDS